MVQSRWKWVLLGIALALIVAEIGLNALKAPTALVRVVNRGDYAITELVLNTGTTHTPATQIDAGQSAVFTLSGWGKEPLHLKFTQFDNPMTNFELPAFEPRRLRREGSVLVLEVKPDEIVRYQEPDETPSRWHRIVERVRDSVNEAETPPSLP